MNANQLINMVINMVMRRLVGRGVNAGINMASRKMGKNGDAAGPDSAETTKRAKQAMRVGRRIGKF